MIKINRFTREHPFPPLHWRQKRASFLGFVESLCQEGVAPFRKTPFFSHSLHSCLEERCSSPTRSARAPQAIPAEPAYPHQGRGTGGGETPRHCYRKIRFLQSHFVRFSPGRGDQTGRGAPGSLKSRNCASSVCRSTTAACAGVGWIFICFWNFVCACHAPALMPSTPR